MNRSELESLAAEAAYFDELQRERDAAAELRRQARPQDDVLDWQDAEYARNQAAIDEAWRQHTAGSGVELQRRVDQLRQWRKDHQVFHEQIDVAQAERLEQLAWRVQQLHEELERQVQNHHELCTTMSSVLRRLEALDRLEDTTQARPYDDEGIPY